MELLQNLDPTFWCLDDFIALADQTSQHSSASFQELVNLYVSSLTCQYLGSQNYYYDKSVLFAAPQLLVGAIRRCEAVDLFCDDLPARLAIRKLRQIAHRHSAPTQLVPQVLRQLALGNPNVCAHQEVRLLRRFIPVEEMPGQVAAVLGQL